MDHAPLSDSDSASTNSDAIDMEWDGYTAYMSENEIESELAALQQEEENLEEHNSTVIECPTTLTDEPPATPKISSVVVTPAAKPSNKKDTDDYNSKMRVRPMVTRDKSPATPKISSIVVTPATEPSKKKDAVVQNGNMIERPTVSKDERPATPKLSSIVVIPEQSSLRKVGNHVPTASRGREFIKLKSKRSKNGSAKTKAGKEDGSLIALLSKVTMSNKERLKSTEPNMLNSVVTPASIKRNRSAGSTPEEPKRIRSTQNLMAKTTLNLKVCTADRPPTGNDLKEVKRFLQSEVQASIDNGATFIPIFSDPCTIRNDGVYLYCADTICANWVFDVVKSRIGSVPGNLVVLPHETPLEYKLEHIMIRVVTCIPTRLPKAEILKNLAKLNMDLDTEKWCIKNARPKGKSSSTVIMRIDQRSFDAISAKDFKVNWLLGPITITKEVHKPSQKKSRTSSSSSSSGTNFHPDPNLDTATGI